MRFRSVNVLCVSCLFAAGLLLAMPGCAVLRLITPDEGPFKLTLVSSKSLAVQMCWVKPAKEGEGYVLHGIVAPIYGARTTTRTHLKARFLDSSGVVLREDEAQFSPRELVGTTIRQMGPPHGGIKWNFKDVPQGTAQIEVRAQDEST